MNKLSIMLVVVAAVLVVVLSTDKTTLSSAQGMDEPSSSTNCNASLINVACDYHLVEGFQPCCRVLRDVIDSRRKTVCFCSLIPDAVHDSTMSKGYMDMMFSSCEMDGTVDDLCSGSKIGIIIGISVGVVILVVLSIIGAIFFCKRSKNKSITANDLEDVNNSQIANAGSVGFNGTGLVTAESLQYELEDIEVATNNFSKDNKIGRGGFGIVYKGILPDGQQIAVKRLSNGSGQGDKEFQTEVVLLAKLKHKNLVRLLGFCITDDEAILVYEYVANKSLDYFLFDSEKREELKWPNRFEIIKGVARGMMYIHEDSPVRMMHRDLKAANILLDSEMYPKIADFGLARICDVGQTHINATRVVGTHGYMAPEYLFHGQFSAKSDVYALGVLILEVVSGRKVSGSSFDQQGGEGLLNYAWRCWEDEKLLEVMDPMLKDSFSNEEILKCVKLGLLCVQEDSNSRPTMSTVVHMLSSHSGLTAISAPQHPAYIYSGGGFQQSTTVSTTSSIVRLIP